MSYEITALFNQMTPENKIRLTEHAKDMLDHQQAILTIKPQDPDSERRPFSLNYDTAQAAIYDLKNFEKPGCDSIITDRAGTVLYRYIWAQAQITPTEINAGYRIAKDRTGYWLKQRPSLNEE